MNSLGLSPPLRHALPASSTARRAVGALPWLVLPSGLWRITEVVVLGNGRDDPTGASTLPAWLPIEVYVVLLSIVAEALALVPRVLVSHWGERFPRWLPRLAGRPVPALPVTAAALGVGVGITAVTTFAALSIVRGVTIQGAALPADFPLHGRDIGGLLAIFAYVPLLLCGPLLAVAALAYWGRRRAVAREVELAVKEVPCEPTPTPHR
jgi:hypothetical protein